MVVLVVVISGPIASGKSTLGRAVAEELESRHLSAAVVDLDLVYEMLDPRREPKSDQERWGSARRAAGLIVHTLLTERCAVVVEGDFMTTQKRVDFCQGLPDGVRTRFVTLRVAFDEALRRAQADPTRGISKDPDFLAAQYEQAQVAAEDAPATDLRVDTGTASVAEASRAIADWAVHGQAMSPMS